MEGVLMQKRTVREALQHVADYPAPLDDEVIMMHTGELIARTLYDIANKPDVNERGSMARANKSRRLIMNYLAGRRRAGTDPHHKPVVQLQMNDLTGGRITDGSGDRAS
jgi:hypothetical protein